MEYNSSKEQRKNTPNPFMKPAQPSYQGQGKKDNDIARKETLRASFTHKHRCKKFETKY